MPYDSSTSKTAVNLWVNWTKCCGTAYTIQQSLVMSIRWLHYKLKQKCTYSVRQKKYPLKFCAIFLATARNFYMKFHTFITHS